MRIKVKVKKVDQAQGYKVNSRGERPYEGHAHSFDWIKKRKSF